MSQAKIKETICGGLDHGINKPDEVFMFSYPAEDEYYFDTGEIDHLNLNIDSITPYPVAHIEYLMKEKGYSLPVKKFNGPLVELQFCKNILDVHASQFYTIN